MEHLTPHNPDNLTDEQVQTAEGWRLLDEDEIELNSLRDIDVKEIWYMDKWNPASCKFPEYTYRTRLSRAELRKARGLEE